MPILFSPEETVEDLFIFKTLVNHKCPTVNVNNSEC